MIQPWFIELISLISDIVVSLSAILVAVFAGIGLNQWRSEMRGRTKYEIARKMAVLTFEYRDKYKRARNIFTTIGESADRVKREEESKEATILLNEYYARKKRLEPLQNTLGKLHETCWEAEIILDKNIDNFVQPLEKSFAELYSAVETYFGTKIKKPRNQMIEDSKDSWLEPHFRRIYGTATDEISQAIDLATEELVDKLKTYMN